MDDLLNTQSLEPNPYESVSPSVLMFNTQCSDDAPSKERRSRWKWSHTEDVLLIVAWLNTSKDPKFPAFWRGIASYYNSNPMLAGMQKREPSHCRQRWRKINDAVRNFVRCYEAATTQISTGQNENDDDVMTLANQIYLNDHKVKFNMEHGWRELRHNPKWCASLSIKKTTKRRKCEDGSGQSSSSHPVLSSDGEDDEAIAACAPPGVKASKVKPKRNVEGEDKSELEFQRMWELKQKDFDFKEKLSKHKLLDTLLTKTEPLSQMEMALKNKLIDDMLSS